MSNMWQKIVSMVRKTGDRCIVFDSQTEEALVVMDFGSYERIIDKNPPKTLPLSHFSGRIQPVIEALNRIKPKPVPPVKIGEQERLTAKPNLDTINPDFDIPLSEIPEDEENQPQDFFADVSGKSVGTPSSFYLEPIE